MRWSILSLLLLWLIDGMTFDTLSKMINISNDSKIEKNDVNNKDSQHMFVLLIG